MSSIGETLSEVRKKQGKNIIQVEEATKIPGKYIKALEANQFDVIPGDVYVKGSLRAYASYLGLDSAELLEEYKKLQQPPPPKKEKEKEVAIISSVARQRSRKKWVVVGVVVVVAAFLGGLLWLGSIERKSIEVLGGKTKREEKLPEKTEKAKPSPQEQPVAVPTPGVTVKLMAIGKYGSSLRVLADGSEVFAGKLEPGQEKEWSANQSITIRASNVRGLEVIKNGEDLGLFGQSNQIEERTFTSGE